jgi:hypothetical protein
MMTPEELLAKADEAETIAEQTPDPAERERMLGAAAYWRARAAAAATEAVSSA